MAEPAFALPQLGGIEEEAVTAAFPCMAAGTTDARALQSLAATAFAQGDAAWSPRRRLAFIVATTAALWAAVAVSGWLALA